MKFLRRWYRILFDTSQSRYIPGNDWIRTDSR